MNVNREWKRNWIIFSAIIVHGVWGFVLLFSPAPLFTTPLGLIHAIPDMSHEFVGVAYLLCSVSALVPLVYWPIDTPDVGWRFAIPQQFVLMVSFFTAAISVATGCYPDGYVPDSHGNPHLFILVDQLWPMVGMIAHSLALVDWYWWSVTSEYGDCFNE